MEYPNQQGIVIGRYHVHGDYGHGIADSCAKDQKLAGGESDVTTLERHKSNAHHGNQRTDDIQSLRQPMVDDSGNNRNDYHGGVLDKSRGRRRCGPKPQQLEGHADEVEEAHRRTVQNLLLGDGPNLFVENQCHHRERNQKADAAQREWPHGPHRQLTEQEGSPPECESQRNQRLRFSLCHNRTSLNPLYPFDLLKIICSKQTPPVSLIVGSVLKKL